MIHSMILQIPWFIIFLHNNNRIFKDLENVLNSLLKWLFRNIFKLTNKMHKTDDKQFYW